MAEQTDLHCTVCHEFTVRATEGNPIDSSRAALVPSDQQCLGCHEMRERLGRFAPDDEPHGAKCGTCHNPHGQTTPQGAFQSCATSGCHARSDTLTAMHRNLGRHRLQTCGACHGAHTWKANAVDCKSCHTGISDPAVRTRPPDPPAATSSRGHAPISRGRDLLAPSPHPANERLTVRPASWSGTRQAGSAMSPMPAGRWQWRSEPTAASLTLASGSRQGRDTARFEHARHASVTCTTCHGTRAGHGDLKVRVARDCQGCHHGNTATGKNCAACHTPQEIGAARPVATTFALTVWTQPRSRSLGFAHDQHARLECAGCHDDSRQRTVERTCASCHSEHHTTERNCAACHPASRETHTRALHATGCAGSGCHEAERGTAVSPVRATCLACHAEQRDHKANKECAPCHLSAWADGTAGRP